MSQAVCKAASDKKARDIVVMDMRDLSPSTDYFVVCSANTATQVRAIADSIEEQLQEAGVDFFHKEGYREGEWILMDYFDVVIHIFQKEKRAFFRLDELWSDGEEVNVRG